jgi:hypothetical protein
MKKETQVEKPVVKKPVVKKPVVKKPVVKKQKVAEAVQPEPTITFNNKTYVAKDLPSDIRELVNIHQKWTVKIGEAREEVFKYEAAIRGLLSELENRFKAFDTPAAPPAV